MTSSFENDFGPVEPQPDFSAGVGYGDSDISDADDTTDRSAAGLMDMIPEPDAGLTEEKKRSPKAERYETKARGLFSLAWKLTVDNERTVDDSAAILLYSPDIAEALGDLADDNPWVAKALDTMTEASDNAALALVAASLPFMFQVLRNHEPVAEIQPLREFKIPFMKGRSVKIRFRMRLGKFRKFTTEPKSLRRQVYSDPTIAANLKKQGIKVDL